MKVIQASAEVGDDRVLRVPLPADAPVGSVDVVVVIEPRRAKLSVAERLAAARAGRGALKDLRVSTDDFLTERRDDEQRREEAIRR